MKRASQVSALFFILFLAYAAMTGDQNPKVETSPSGVAALQKTQSYKLKDYVLNLPQTLREDSPPSKTEVNIVAKSVAVKGITAGKETGNVGVSKEKDVKPKLGPAAFVYSKKLNAFIVLDNQNNRINIYPADGKGEAQSIPYAGNKQSLGIAVDAKGDLVMLTRQVDPQTAQAEKEFEILKFNPTNREDPWKESARTFHFDGKETNGAAQDLEFQAMGDAFVFKGIRENEFHILRNGRDETQKLPGFPTKEGNILRLVPKAGADGNLISFQEYNPRNQAQKTGATHENMDRLADYKVLPNGLLALNLDPDNAKQLPRELVLIDRKDGSVKARTTLKENDQVTVQHDTFYQDQNLYQFVQATDKEKNQDNNGFEILRTKIGEI